MIDPGSIVGTTRFVLGAISFLLTTLSKLDEDRCELFECQERLRRYRLELSVCQSKILSWILIWHGRDPFPPDTYKYFWSDKHDDIVDGLTEMHQLSAQIVDDVLGKSKESKMKRHQTKAGKDGELPGRTAKIKASFRRKMRPPNQTTFLPQEDDWRLWRLITGILQRDPDAKPEIRDVSGLCRIAFALFKNQALGDRLDRLTRRVANMTEVSRRQFLKLQDKDSQTTTNETLQQAERLMHCVDKLGGFTEATYEGQKRVENARGWALELRIADGHKSLEECDREALLDLDFTCHIKDKQEGWTRRRLRVPYDCGALDIPKTVDLPNSTIDGSVTQTAAGADPTREFQIQRPPARISRPFRGLFQEGFFDRMEVYKAWEADRARLALSLVNWVILLWKTSWTVDPCCCGLRLAHLPTGDPCSVHTFTVEGHLECGHNLCKLENLGIVLAELITARPLRVATVPDWFEYQQWQQSTDGGFWKAISRELLLQEIDEKSQSRGIVKAVEYCLDNRSSLTRENLRPQVLLQLIESIFTPVEEYCMTRLNARKRFSDRSWWKNYIFGCAWPYEAYEFDDESLAVEGYIQMTGRPLSLFES